METDIFLSARWEHLAMLNYEVDPSLLQSRVPAGTELDECNGKTFVSIVGFMFLNARVFGLRIPFHTNFEEVNLRFYVRRKTDEGWRRGVVFIKEIVPKKAIAAVARTVYNENYVALRMRHGIDLGSQAGVVEYGWQFKNRWNTLRVKVFEEPQPIVPHSEEEFITEHYWGYVSQRDGGTIEYAVEHPRWLVWQVNESVLDCDVTALYGDLFVEPLSQKVNSAFLAQGSEVIVRKGVRLY